MSSSQIQIASPIVSLQKLPKEALHGLYQNSMTKQNRRRSQRAKQGFGKQDFLDDQQKPKQLSPIQTTQHKELLLTQDSCNKALIHAVSLLAKGDLKQSKRILQELALIGTSNSETHYYLGTIYLLESNFDEALEHLLRAKDLGELTSQLCSNIGIAYRRVGNIKDATYYFNKAASLDPNNLNTLIHLANILQETGNYTDSINRYKEIIRIDPKLADAHWGLALSLLARKEFVEGWNEYEWRWNSKRFSFDYLKTAKPIWSPCSTFKRLLIWGEQGVGDQIMFASMLGQAKDFASQVLVQLDRRLIQLFQQSFSSLTFLPSDSEVSEAAYDCHLPIASLGMHLRNSERDFLDQRHAYLIVDSERSHQIRSTLTDDHRLICGISWNSRASLGSEKSIALQKLAEALDSPNLKLVSLQYGDVDDEIADVRHKSGIIISQASGVDCTNDLSALACLINACDVVVSISNTTAHLAGALGKKTLLLLKKIPNWRWADSCDQCLWYENIHIYHQTTSGNWDSALSQVRQELPELLRNL